MISVSSVLITLVLSSVLSSHLVVVAMPETKGEDAMMEQGSLGSLLGEESLTDRAMLPSAYANGLMLNNYRADDGNPNVLIFSDMRQKGQGIRGLSPGFTRSLPQITDRKMNQSPGEYSLKMDRRNTELDMLRCMIGRVYRPCWGTSN